VHDETFAVFSTLKFGGQQLASPGLQTGRDTQALSSVGAPNGFLPLAV
jgi:hypothetical protein